MDKAHVDTGSPPGDTDAERRAAGRIDLAGLDGLSLYEKKCVLVNREIDAQGMGRYQWYIWCLCGFGYLLDLLWAQAFGLVLSPLQQELGFGNDVSGNISTSFSAGMTAGAFTWGLLADVIGMSSWVMLLMRPARLTDLRSPMGVQPDVSHRLRLWPRPRCRQRLQHLSCVDCICWCRHRG